MLYGIRHTMDCETLMEKACLYQAYEVMQENMD